jgi:D-amino peptidase
VALNGTAVTEGAFNAAIAGHFGVPVIMISGDDAAVAEVRSLVGNIEGAEVKRAISFHAAESMTPDASCQLIGQKVRAAFARLKDFKPYRVSAPVTLDIGFKNYRPVELLGWLRGVERVDSHTIRYRGQDILDISTFVEFLSHYDFNLEP